MIVRFRQIFTFLIVAALLTFGASHARAVTFDLSTGAGGGAPGTPDLNWIAMGPGGYFQPVTVAPHPAWVANDATSQWIGPHANGKTSAAVGPYIYTYDFILAPEINPASLMLINGKWTSDNQTVGVFVNGQDTGNSLAHNMFGQLHDLVLDSSLWTTGQNTVAFHVNNKSGGGQNPSGLRVQGELVVFESTFQSLEDAPATPEPAALGLVGLLAAGLGLTRRRRA